MNEYELWREWIKSLGTNIYMKELGIIGNNKVQNIFYNELDNIESNKDIILTVNVEDLEQSPYKLYYYIKKLQENFLIYNIKILKLNNKEDYSESFFAYFFCIYNKNYTKDPELYKKIFPNEIVRECEIVQLIYKLIEQKKNIMLNFNNLINGDNKEDIDNLYLRILRNKKRQQQKILKDISRNMNKKSAKQTGYIISDEQIIKHIKENIVKEDINIKLNKTLKLKKMKERKKYCNYVKRLQRQLACEYKSFVAVINIKNTNIDYYIELLHNIDKECLIILISQEGKEYKGAFMLKDVYSAINILSGYKAFYIFDDKSKEINDSALINININKSDLNNKEYFMNLFVKNSNMLKPFANVEHKNSVKVLTTTFLNFEGTNYYCGGAERYLIDLHKVCNDLGFKLRIYQKANYNFFRYYNDIEIIGLSNNDKNYMYKHEDNVEILKKYNKLSKNSLTSLNIYSSFMETMGKSVCPSIGISHGVAWDNMENDFIKDSKENSNSKKWIVESAQCCDKVISVDTNTANYFQTADYKLGNEMEVIPNYVDIEKFKQDDKKDTKKTVILYPRRLYKPRGLYMLLDVTDKILENNKNVEIHFVGKGFKKDISKILEKIDKWGDEKIKLYNRPPEEMHLVYKNADITLIPTLYSEGTSLSCLEAMATGNAVIATRVGGLTDLIINNYNGKLIEPNREALYDAINEFINNPELRNKCRKNAIEVAKEFNKKNWESKWKSVIKETISKLPSGENINYKIVKIYTNDDSVDDVELNNRIRKFLVKNYVVYIVTKSNLKKFDSYGRLQYISSHDELYRNADEVYIYKNYDGEKIEDSIEFIK